MEAKTAETMKSLAVTTIGSIRQPVATLSGGQRQSVAVARAVMWNSRLVILDEPTAALGVAQTQQVLELVARLAEQGLAVVLISHNLHDIFEVARPDHRAAARPQRRASTSATRRRSRRSSQAITAGVPTKVAGIPSTNRAGRPHEHRRDRRRAEPPCPRASSGACVDNIRGGNLGSWPVLIGLAVIVDLLLLQGRQLPQPRQLQQHHHADGRHDPAGLRRRLRPPDRRDRPLDQLHQRHRRRRRRAS